MYTLSRKSEELIDCFISLYRAYVFYAGKYVSYARNVDYLIIIIYYLSSRRGWNNLKI